ncbi:hypothetical protein [Paraburkholderia ultramafica]|uniref:hypothetical protein n=1 Tax=Paraburkholderia ultramafica TaxID=1544867 RepID=UPI0015825220|nr:hypothetical protein [Paraburkholderia ultramafica]
MLIVTDVTGLAFFDEGDIRPDVRSAGHHRHSRSPAWSALKKRLQIRPYVIVGAFVIATALYATGRALAVSPVSTTDRSL